MTSASGGFSRGWSTLIRIRPAFTEAEKTDLSGWRWWTVKELQITTDNLTPRQLAAHLSELLRNGPPEDPIHVGVRGSAGGRRRRTPAFASLRSGLRTIAARRERCFDFGSLQGVDREAAILILDRLHAAQNVFYGGGEEQELRALLAPDITWTVPGRNPIAGTYQGIEEVFGYFVRRRDRAGGTFRMHRRDVLAGEGSRIAAPTDGTALIAGSEHAWSTVGLYEITERDRIAACWLLPLDQAAFDAIWSS